MDAKKRRKKRAGNAELSAQALSLPAAAAPPIVARDELEEELLATKEHLVGTIAALQGSNEELTVSNEEMTALNEELQTVNAQLEVTKEELQTANQELAIANEQLAKKVAELEAANNDVVNLLHCTEIATIFLDRKLRIRRFTPAATTVVNLIAADVGRPLAQLTLKVPDVDLYSDCERVLREFSPREKDIATEQGQWWLRRIVPYVTANHRIDGVAITYQDITHVKHADQRTRLLATVLMESSDAMIVHDFQGRISTWNRGAERLYGYSEAEAMQMNVDRLIPESSRAEMQLVWQRIERGERVQSWEAQRITRSGQTVDVWITLTALADHHGRPVAIARIDRDVTERTRARARLEEEVKRRTRDLADQRTRLRAILDSASDAIVTIDPAGKVESVNAAAERIFGYTTGEMIGQNVNMLMPAPYCDEHDGYLLRYRETGEKHIMGMGREVEARRKDGTIFPVELTVTQVEHLDLYMGLVRDVTQRKNLEREVIEIALLEQQRIGQDLHDECGQRLTALALLSNSLVEPLRETLPAEAELARKIECGLKYVLRQVRSVARGLAWGEVRPETLPAALAELASRLCETSGLRCTLDIAEGARVRDAIEATHLYHIAQEACTNALKHARADSIAVRLFLADDGVSLEVRDDGVGMPQPGHQEGLGLRIMRNRASVMGAELTIEPVEPHGTLVTCTCRSRGLDSSHPMEPGHGPQETK